MHETGQSEARNYEGIHDLFAAQADSPGFLDEIADGPAFPILEAEKMMERVRICGAESETVLSILADLLAGTGFPRAAVASQTFTPEHRSVRPRVGLIASANLFRITDEANGWSKYECALTQKRFSQQTDAPVPCLMFDRVGAADGVPFDSGSAMPADREPRMMIVHPALVVAGPKYVLAAYWRMLARRVYDVAETLSVLVEDATLALGTRPEDVGSVWPDRALLAWRDYRALRPDGGDVPLSEAELDGLKEPFGWISDPNY